MIVATTVGLTRYLQEWLECVKLLDPDEIIIVQDTLRSGEIPDSVKSECKIIKYKTVQWKGEEYKADAGSRKIPEDTDLPKEVIKNFDLYYKNMCNVSMFLGVLKAIRYALLKKNDLTFIDSDVMIGRKTANYIKNTSLDWVIIATPCFGREHLERGYIYRVKDKYNYIKKHLFVHTYSLNSHVKLDVLIKTYSILKKEGLKMLLTKKYPDVVWWDITSKYFNRYVLFSDDVCQYEFGYKFCMKDVPKYWIWIRLSDFLKCFTEDSLKLIAVQKIFEAVP